MIKIEYSVLCHYPSIVANDCITLAILFYDKGNKKCIFRTTKNWNRVRTFNDELDIDLVKLQLEGIDNEVCQFAKGKDFDLQKYTKFYINELKFTKVTSVLVEDFDEFVTDCTRQYLPFDLDKKDRPSVEEQVRFIKSMLKQSEIKYENGKVHGYFNEDIKFDFIIKEYAFKLFRFEGKNEARLVKGVKDWAYDAYKLKNRYKIIFVTDIDFTECNEYKTLFNILNEECEKVINFNEVMPVMSSIR